MNVPYKHYYLVDSSAFGRYTDPSHQPIKHDILTNAIGGYFYYIPQFCIAEIFNTFAKWREREKRITDKDYEALCDFLKSMVHNRAFLYAYDLHRYHNLNCDKIYKIEQSTPKKKGKSHLSTFDILIIAMAIELQLIHGKENITILSSDDRLITIANLLNIQTESYQ